MYVMHVLLINYVFVQVFQAPFGVCADRLKKTIVLTVRGTLSIKDALTDLSISMDELETPDRIPDDEYNAQHQFVHKVGREGGREGGRESGYSVTT